MLIKADAQIYLQSLLKEHLGELPRKRQKVAENEVEVAAEGPSNRKDDADRLELIEVRRTLMHAV